MKKSLSKNDKVGLVNYEIIDIQTYNIFSSDVHTKILYHFISYGIYSNKSLKLKIGLFD